MIVRFRGRVVAAWFTAPVAAKITLFKVVGFEGGESEWHCWPS